MVPPCPPRVDSLGDERHRYHVCWELISLPAEGKDRMQGRSFENKDLLHHKLRAILCEKIYSNDYPSGALIPTERELASSYVMSRVTVRSTLAEMEAEGLISRRQGHGTRVTLRTTGYPCHVDLVAVIAPAQNPFFAEFMMRFEESAVERDALVVFKQAADHTVVDSLFNFYSRSIHNIVVWPYDELVDTDKLLRLRGLGMNLVFFDRVIDSPSVDSVSVDNAHAVETLYGHLRSRGARRIAYVGWQNEVLSSNRERELAFVRLAGSERLYRLPWNKEAGVDAQIGKLMLRIRRRADAILCGNGVIGISARRYLLQRRSSLGVACVDDLPGAAELGLTVYSQPLDRLAGMVCRRLLAQAEQASSWRAQTYLIKGTLVVRR